MFTPCCGCTPTKEGTHNHPLPVEGFVKKAIARLQQLKLDDISELFSLRLNNTLRLYGIRDERIMMGIKHKL
jgi:hypothetical protein